MEDDNDLHMVDSAEGYNKACLEIMALVRREQTKTTNSEFITSLCDDVEKMIDEAHRHAFNMMEVMGGVRPSFVLLSKAGDGLLIPIILDGMPEDIQSRMRIAAPLQVCVNMAPIDAYFFVSEMWMASYPKDSKEEFKRPSERADRQEGVMVCCYQPDKTTFRIFEITRDAAGKCTALTPSKWTENSDDGTKYTATNPMLENFFTVGKQIKEFVRRRMSDERTVH
jgi:hypothetical protein